MNYRFTSVLLKPGSMKWEEGSETRARHTAIIKFEVPDMAFGELSHLMAQAVNEHPVTVEIKTQQASFEDVDQQGMLDPPADPGTNGTKPNPAPGMFEGSGRRTSEWSVIQLEELVPTLTKEDLEYLTRSERADKQRVTALEVLREGEEQLAARDGAQA